MISMNTYIVYQNYEHIFYLSRDIALTCHTKFCYGQTDNLLYPEGGGKKVKPLTLKQFQRSMDCIFAISIIVEVENSNSFNALTTGGLAAGSKLTMFSPSKELTLI